MMNYYKRKSFAVIVLLGIFVFSCKSGKQLGNSGKKLPNIIFLIADDAGYGDLGCYGQQKFATPNLDRMAAEGMRFTAHYAGATGCAPSRSSLMTGLHTGHTPIRGNKGMEPEGQMPLPDGTMTLAMLMQQAGYVTGGFGKWGLGGPGSTSTPEQKGFDLFFGYNCQSLAHNYYPEYLWRNDVKVFQPGNAGNGTGQYSFDVIHKEALQFIGDHRKEPFFLFLPYTVPHAELLAPDDKMLQQFAGKFEETPYKGIDEGPTYRKGPYGSQTQPRATFAAMMTRLDPSVGDILKALKKYGLDENTLFIFTSDNGPHKEGGADPDFFDSNGPYKGYKRDLYEGGIRVPMIARWPGTIGKGSTTGHISAFWDWLPTFCQLANRSVPEGIDGLSLVPTLLNRPGQPQHPYLYWEFYEQGGRQAVRMGPWKGIRQNVAKNPNSALELYNLDQDPGENNNVAAQHPDIIQQMETLMKEAHVPSEDWKW